jgi:hypothetical protein
MTVYTSRFPVKTTTVQVTRTMANLLLAAEQSTILYLNATMYHKKEKNAPTYKSHGNKKEEGERKWLWIRLYNSAWWDNFVESRRSGRNFRMRDKRQTCVHQ